mgnify:CR=1 FL=1
MSWGVRCAYPIGLFCSEHAVHGLQADLGMELEPPQVDALVHVVGMAVLLIREAGPKGHAPACMVRA